MNKDIILLTAAILMSSMVGPKDIDASLTDPAVPRRIREDCIGQAIQLWADLERLVNQAVAQKGIV